MSRKITNMPHVPYRPDKVTQRQAHPETRTPSPQRWQAQIDDLCHQRNEYKRHADKLKNCEAQAKQLAEALRISTTTLETVYGNDRKNIAARCCVERNSATLAAYEASRQ